MRRHKGKKKKKNHSWY